MWRYLQASFAGPREAGAYGASRSAQFTSGKTADAVEKQFTRDVIDTLGKRLFEVRIPDPASTFATALGRKLAVQMAEKGSLRARIVEIVSSIEPVVPPKSRNRPGWSMRG